MRLKRLIVVLFALVATTSGCLKSSSELLVDDTWGRTSPKVATNAAFYMTISGGDTDDVLIAADADVCGVVELHETVMSNDVMKMQHLPDGVPVAAGSEVILEPGGLHIMCMNKKVEFVEGDSFEVTLVFEKTESMLLEFDIRGE